MRSGCVGGFGLEGCPAVKLARSIKIFSLIGRSTESWNAGKVNGWHLSAGRLEACLRDATYASGCGVRLKFRAPQPVSRARWNLKIAGSRFFLRFHLAWESKAECLAHRRVRAMGSIG